MQQSGRYPESEGGDMKNRRILSVLAVFLLTTGNLLGSDREMRVQARWSELKQLIGGEKVALQLVDGARVEGRIRKVEATSLDIKVKKSSNPAAYSKGRTEIPREAVPRIEVRNSNLVRGGRAAGRIALTGAAFVGALFGSVYALVGKASESEPNDAQFGGSIAIATGVAVLTYRALRPKGITIIEVLPDSPSERSPKPADNNQISRLKPASSSSVGESLPVASAPLVLPAFKHNGIGAAVPSFVEKSRSERLHRQARRAVMRQDLPLDLASRPVHAHRSGID